MKTKCYTNRAQCCGFAAVLPAMLLMLAHPAVGADTIITSTSYLYQVPVPGVLVTNALGQVQLKGNVHLLAVQGSDPRATGRLQGNMDLAYQADGTSLGTGPAYLEVGAWQNQTNFTPMTGVWVLNWRGRMLADNSSQITMSGYGQGGNIDGLRMETTVTRAAGPYPDPAIPYLASGVIKAPPVTITNKISFENVTNWTYLDLGTNGSLSVSGRQITVGTGGDAPYLGPNLPWSIVPGQTLEARVKLVALNGVSAGAMLALYHDFGQGYILFKDSGSVVLLKQMGGSYPQLASKEALTSNTNVVLTLAVSRSGEDVNLTARVLDGVSGEVLEELVALDPVGWNSGVAPVLMLQTSSTPTPPPAEATFEDFELRTYDIPPVGICRAVQITVPCASGSSYTLESAPMPEGPWLPLNNPSSPGVQTFTTPAVKGAEFFRPQLAR